MNKIKNRSKKNIIKRLILLLIILILVILITIISNNSSMFFKNYAISKAKQIALNAINKSVSDESLKYLNNKEFFYLSKDSNDNIITIDYNSVNINQFLNEITYMINSNLVGLADEVIFYMPLGLITNMALLNNLGPKIPVRIELVGYVNTNVKTVVKEYGINNALIELVIYVEATFNVVLPLIEENITIDNEIPVSYKLVQGSVPKFYQGGLEKNSAIYSIPLE